LVTLDSTDDDPVYIPSDFYCDGIVDCDDWSDETLSCDPSLAIGYILVGILSVILALLCILGLVFVLLFRDRGRIRASGVFFLSVLAFFSMLGVLCVWCFFGKANDVNCNLRYWLFFLLSGVLIAQMCAKQWRIYRVFTNKSLKTLTISNLYLTGIICVINIPVIILLIIWSAADNLDARVATNSDQNESLHTICDSDNFWVFIALLMAYQIILLLVSSIFAIITRNFGKYGESKLIGFALYNATLTAVIIVPIIFALDSDYFLQWLLGVLYVEFYFFAPFFILTVPKIYEVLWIDRGKSVQEQRMLPDTGMMTGTNKHSSWFQSKTPSSQKSESSSDSAKN